jgi:Ca-activated chloride channel family protein
MSDGEDHEGEAVEEAKAAAEEGVVIDTIGIGSTAGEPVPDFDASGVMTGYKKDKAGQTVMSRLNEATLKQIAQAAGGVYVHATDNDLGMETVLAEIKKMAKSEMQSRLTVEYEQRYRWLLLPALAMLILVTILPLSAAIRRTKDQGVKNA